MDNESEKRLDRRTLLKFAGIGAGAALLGSRDPNRESVERLLYKPGDIMWKGDERNPQLHYTFDDFLVPGDPSAGSKALERLLQLSEPYGAKMTFFPVGAALRQAPYLWQEAVRKGHAIENHTYGHHDLTKLSDDEIRKEIQMQEELLQETLGEQYTKSLFLRPPFGRGIFPHNYDARIPKIAKELGLIVAMWSVDSFGYNHLEKIDEATVDRIVNNVTVAPGEIVLQHAIDSDIRAFESLLYITAEKGLQSRPLTEVIT